VNLLSHLPSFTSAVNSLGVFPSILIPNDPHVPALVLPQKITLMGGKIMGHWTKFCLRIFLSVKTNIIGKENIINNEKFFIACSHQSMFETFFLQTIFNSPIFILKKNYIKLDQYNQLRY